MSQTHRTSFLKSKNKPITESYSIAEIAKISKVPKKTLDTVFKRGMGAAKTNLASVRLKKDFSKNPDTTKFPASARLSPEQWGYARVYSYVDKGKTYYTADKDLRKK
jgi:hypothetical protein